MNTQIEEYVKNLLILKTGLKKEEIKDIKEVAPGKFEALCIPESPIEKAEIELRLEKENSVFV